MTTKAARRVTLPERFFPLDHPAAVDRFLGQREWCAIFKAGSGDRTVDAWVLVQRAFESRPDIAMGFIQLPAGRAASDRVSEVAGIAHKSPQLLLFHRGQAVGHLDERAIAPESVSALMAGELPSTIGPRVVNDEAVSLEGFRKLLTEFVADRLPEERFQWSYLERLEKEATWRDDATFGLLNGLFENPDGRDVKPARLVAREFQAQLAGRAGPLKARAGELLRLMTQRGGSADYADDAD